MLRLLKFIGRSIGYTVLTALIALVLVQFWFLLHIWYWVDHHPSSTAFMDARLERLRDKNPRFELQYHWVPYTRISANLKRAIVVAEDAKFLDHEGFDWDGIRTAYERNRQKGKVVAGGSTISQQLAKNRGRSGERTGGRKAQEAVIFQFQISPRPSAFLSLRIFCILINSIPQSTLRQRHKSQQAEVPIAMEYRRVRK